MISLNNRIDHRNYQWVYGVFNKNGFLVKVYLRKHFAEGNVKKNSGYTWRTLYLSPHDPF